MSLEESGLGTLGEIMIGDKGTGQPPVSTCSCFLCKGQVIYWFYFRGVRPNSKKLRLINQYWLPLHYYG